ncbi:MAG: hypothetical protein EZS28_045585, partial [Streblomastix strix]
KSQQKNQKRSLIGNDIDWEKRSKNGISRVLEVGLINRAAEALKDNSSSQQQPSQVIIMNILAVLDQVLTAAEKISNSSKLCESLEKLKNEGQSKEIKLKSKYVLSLLEEQDEEEVQKQSNSGNQTLKHKTGTVRAGTVRKLRHTKVHYKDTCRDRS